MPDIAMCTDDSCPNHETCYRYRAVPSQLQNYFVGSPRRPDGTCGYYSKIRPGDRLVQLAPQE